MYLILQKLFNYLKINKPKGYNKLIMQIFAEIRYLCKRFCIVMTLCQNLSDTIAIMITLNTFYDNFKTTTASLFETGDKKIDQIYSILQSKEAKNFSKRTT